MERLTLAQARERVAANVCGAGLTVHDIHWAEPDREALLISGLLPGTALQDERDALQAIALALLGCQAHLDYEAGRKSVIEKVRDAAENPANDVRTANRLLDAAEDW